MEGPRGLHPHELDLAEKGLVGSLKLGKDLGEGGELEAVDPPPSTVYTATSRKAWPWKFT